MRMNTQRILAALLSLVLLLALAPAGWAENGGEGGGDMGAGGDAPVVSASMPATGVNLDPGANTVNINLVPSDKVGTKFETDIVNANLVADLYLVAAAVKDENYDTYHYEFVGNAPVIIADANIFQDSLADDPDPEKQNKQETMLRTFSPLAQAFAKSIFTYEGIDAEKFPTKTAAATGTTIKVEGLDPGLYMLVLHGSDLKQQSENEDECYVTTMTKTGGGQYNEYGNADIDIVATRAFSKECEFIFEPQMITVPTRVDDEGAQQYNTAYGTKWSNELNIVAKPDWKPRYGDLRIQKEVIDGEYARTKATFAYRVVAHYEDKLVYDNICEITIPDNDEVIIEDKIPVGAVVEVSEVYEGSRYKINGSQIVISGDATNATLVINSSDTSPATIKFTNDNDGSPKEGYGILNTFTYDGAQWVWNGEKDVPAEPEGGGKA